MDTYASSETTKLAKALIAVQQQLQPAIKDSTNPFTKSTYATLNSVMDSCREALLSNGIWLTQYPVPAEPGYLGLVTKLTHAESGQWQSSLAIVPLPKNDPQGMGIAMTYTRRYALSAMLGIITEEDTDGEIFKTPEYPRKDEKRQLQPASQVSQKNVPERRVTNIPPQTRQEYSSSIPKLDGIAYKTITDSSGRNFVIATGKVYEKKNLLQAAGFRWDKDNRYWWRYNDAA